jgi:hypothetical protein
MWLVAGSSREPRRISVLSADDRRAVVSAAESNARARRAVASWDTIRKLTGTLALGGNAVEDSDHLYDG